MGGGHFYTTAEVAAALGLHVMTVRAMIKDKRIAAVPFGRKYAIAEAELQRLLREGTGPIPSSKPRQTPESDPESLPRDTPRSEPAAAIEPGPIVLAGGRTHTRRAPTRE
jgi:excisionase family DNA binding protein